MNKEPTGNNLIRNARIVKGYSQEQMADLMGLSQSQYSRMEGTGSGLDIARLKSISRILDVDITKILPLSNKDFPGMETLLEKIRVIEEQKRLIDLQAGAALYEVKRMQKILDEVFSSLIEKDFNSFKKRLLKYKSSNGTKLESK